VNTELARLVRKQVTEFPDTFDMAVWADENRCGTVACIADHAMILSGYSFRMGEGALRDEVYFCRPDGTEVIDIDGEASLLLGITWHDANHLFYVSEEEAVDFLDQLIREGE
jgi:hypothetical protein